MNYNDRALRESRLNNPAYRTTQELEAYVDAFCDGDDERADLVEREARERIAREHGFPVPDGRRADQG